MAGYYTMIFRQIACVTPAAVILCAIACAEPDLSGNDDDPASARSAGCEAPEVVAVGCRYLAITPAWSDTAVALLLTGDPDDDELSCLFRYVQSDGTLGDQPAYMMPDDWETVYVGDELIQPDRVYFVQAECGPEDDPEVTAPASATTWLWGDVDGNRIVNLDDVLLAWSATLGNFEQVSFWAADVAGCTPDRVIDDADLYAVGDAMAGEDFPCPAPWCPRIALALRPIGTYVPRGGVVRMGLYAESLNSLQECFSVVHAVFAWDPKKLELIGNSDDGSFIWDESYFPDDSEEDGLNAPFWQSVPANDGDALYHAEGPPDGPYAAAIPDGALITTILFRALEFGETRVELAAEAGIFSNTQAWCADPIRVFGDADGNGFVDIDDVMCILEQFGAPQNQVCPNGDVYPCGGDGFVDITDALAVLETFDGAVLCPDPCN